MVGASHLGSNVTTTYVVNLNVAFKMQHGQTPMTVIVAVCMKKYGPVTRVKDVSAFNIGSVADETLLTYKVKCAKNMISMICIGASQ